MMFFAGDVREHAVAEVFERVKQFGVVAEQRGAVAAAHLKAHGFAEWLGAGAQVQAALFEHAIDEVYDAVNIPLHLSHPR